MNNNRILIVRGNTGALLAVTDDVVYGQPVYANDKNYLTVGQKKSGKVAFKYKSLAPITVREVKGWFDDNKGITNKTTMPYKVAPTDTELLIESSKDILAKVDATHYLKLNKDQNVISGSTKVEELIVKNVKGLSTDDINVGLTSDTKVLNINRVTKQNKDVKFASDAAVKSKFVVYGKNGTTNSFTVEDADGKSFVKVTGTTQLDKDVTIGTTAKDAKLDVKGNVTASGIISVPTIRTINDATKARIEASDNSSKPYFKVIERVDNKDSIVTEFNTEGSTFNKATTFNDKVTLTSDLEMLTDKKKAKFKDVEIDTLNVKTLKINS